MAKRILGWVLVFHGIICLLGAFFPFYPPINIFYWLFPGHFAIKLIIVLLAGSTQVVYGLYFGLVEIFRRVPWQWLVTITVVFAGLLLIPPVSVYPQLFEEFPAGGGPQIITPTPTPVPLGTPYENPDDVVPTPGGPQYRANVQMAGQENPWPPIQTNEAALGGDTVYIRYRDYIETEAGQKRNNIVSVRTPGYDIKDVNLRVTSLPSGIGVRQGMEWHGLRTIARVLVVETAPGLAPGEFTFEIGVEIEGKEYGNIPCSIKVLK